MSVPPNPAAAGALRFFDDDFTAAALAVHEEHLAAAGREFTNELRGFVELFNRLFEVDDMNLVAGTEDVLSHLRIPETGLVAEVATRFEHFTHAGHLNFSKYFSLTSDTGFARDFRVTWMLSGALFTSPPPTKAAVQTLCLPKVFYSPDDKDSGLYRMSG